MHRRRSDEDDDQKDDEDTCQRAGFANEDATQLMQAGNFRHRLQRPEHGKQPGGPRVRARDHGRRRCECNDGVDETTATGQVTPQPTPASGIVDPQQPFQHEESLAQPQHHLDPMVSQFVARIEGQDDQADQADRQHGVGNRRHAAARRRRRKTGNLR